MHLILALLHTIFYQNRGLHMRKFIVLTSLIFWVSLVISSPVLAAETSDAMGEYRVALDTVWVLITGFLVAFMQAGFAVLEAGATQAKNTANIVMKNLMDFALGSVVFLAVGFAIMFGSDMFGFFGTTGFFGIGDFTHLGLSIPIAAFLLFQTAFAGTAATIVSGALAERTRFFAYVAVSIIICIVIYPVVGHWIWGGGWLQKLGMIDFAGSTVVHSVGGWVALVGAYLVGPRIGKYGKDGTVNTIPGNNIVFAALGVFILWFGWFGFNPGSTLSAFNLDIAKIALNTNIAAAAAAVMAMFASKLLIGKVNVTYTMNGALAGLVAITAGCQAVDTFGALFIGLASGAVVVFALRFIDNTLRIDDPVGAISVHAVCGVFGTIMVGLFSTINGQEGLFYGGGIKVLTTQLIGVISVFLWTTITAYIMFKVIDKVIGLRVDEEDEEKGLDSSEHEYQEEGSIARKILEGLNRQDNKKISAMLDLNNDDEMKELVIVLNDMAKKQSSLAEKLTICSNRLSSQGQNLSASSEEISGTIQEIAATTHEIANISLKGSRNTVEMVDMSNKVKDVANLGNSAIQGAVLKIDEVLKTSNDMVSSMKELNLRSLEIDQIIVVMSEIAAQTNLLALNAAIESNRAGHEGLAFSVIAQQIRKLAEDSSKSANEVKKLIQDVKLKTKSVVDKMEINSHQIEQGSLTVNQAGKSLEDIISAIDQTNILINEVATDTSCTNDETQKLASATEQITQTTQDMTSSATTLAYMAQELQELVEEYKLNITPQILADLNV